MKKMKSWSQNTSNEPYCGIFVEILLSLYKITNTQNINPITAVSSVNRVIHGNGLHHLHTKFQLGKRSPIAQHNTIIL